MTKYNAVLNSLIDVTSQIYIEVLKIVQSNYVITITVITNSSFLGTKYY